MMTSNKSTEADDDDKESNDYDFTSYVAAAQFPPYAGPHDEEQRLLGQAHQTLRRLYAEGVPFFTKATMKDIVDQIDRGAAIISVPGLDDSKLELPIRTGEVFPVDTRRDSIYIITKPRLDYRRMQFLTQTEATLAPLASVFYPVLLAHSTMERDFQTGKTLLPWPALTYDETTVQFDRQRTEWKASAHYAQLEAALDSISFSKSVQKIVAFGCGTLQCKPAIESTAQYALVLMLRDLLARRLQLQQPDILEASSLDSTPMTEVPCFAQDPIHTDVDERVLLEHGITVVDDPRGFLQVDDTSIVVSICTDIPVKDIIADIARPALLVWDKVHAPNSSIGSDSPRVWDMISRFYTEYEFPADEDRFYKAALYVRND